MTAHGTTVSKQHHSAQEKTLFSFMTCRGGAALNVSKGDAGREVAATLAGEFCLDLENSLQINNTHKNT